MANFLVTTQIFGPDDFITIAAAMEAYIETVTNTKTIRVFQVVGCARDAEVMGIIIHDT